MTRKKSHFTVTDKGQVTIPHAVRKKLGIEPGAQIAFEIKGNQIVLTKADPIDRVRAVMGILGRLNTDEVMASLRPHYKK